MAAVPQSDSVRVALYARVSTEDQADRGTIQAQLTLLRNLAQTFGWIVVGEYVDDGISGTIPLDQRPEGRRLLDGVAGGLIVDAVVAYRLDRLGRSLRALLDAHDALERAGVAIKSATEPFDTSTSIGTFLFQLLGSLAQLEKSTITERMTMGRDRVAKEGKWTNGPIPFGYDLARPNDGEGSDGPRQRAGVLVPSERLVEPLGITEADLVRDIFRRVAEGSSAMAEAKRLQALGVPRVTRHPRGRVVVNANPWEPTRLCKMLRSPRYMGVHLLETRNDPGTPIQATAPALVDRETFERVGMQLRRNRNLSKKNANRTYLLRGLIRCASCGRGFSGSVRYANGKGFYYRCNGALYHVKLDPAERCKARNIPGDWLDDLVWQDCRSFILNPGDALAEARRQLRERMARTTTVEAEIRQRRVALRGKEAERERVMTMFRRGRITLDDFERQIDAMNAETAELRTTIDGLECQARVTEAYEARFAEVSSMLGALKSRVDDIERTGDIEAKRQIVEMLVAEIVVSTTGKGAGKTATVRVSYTFAPKREPVALPDRLGEVCSRNDRASGLYLSRPGTES